MMATLILTLVIVAVAVVLLGVKIFFVKGGRFPNTHIHDNPEMRKRGSPVPRTKNFLNKQEQITIKEKSKTTFENELH